METRARMDLSPWFAFTIGGEIFEAIIFMLEHVSIHLSIYNNLPKALP